MTHLWFIVFVMDTEVKISLCEQFSSTGAHNFRFL